MPYNEKIHQDKVNRFEDITICLRNIFDAKNRDYGDSFGKSFEEWGLPMACIRLDDKLNRLKSFARGQKMLVNDESVRDTLMDMANYAIMTLIELDSTEKNKEE